MSVQVEHSKGDQYMALVEIWHRGHQKNYVPGDKFDLDHLNSRQVGVLVGMRAVRKDDGCSAEIENGDTLELQEIRGVSAARALVMKRELGVETKEDLIEANAEAVGAAVGWPAEKVESLQAAVRKQLSAEEDQ